MFKLFVNNAQVDVKWHEFSDGAITCKVDIPQLKSAVDGYENKVMITQDATYPVTHFMFALGLLQQTVLEYISYGDTSSFDLTITYLPYARADRKFSEGEPESPLLTFISSLPVFDRIFVLDPHNADPLTSNTNYIRKAFIIEPQHKLFMNSIAGQRVMNLLPEHFVLVAPDKGSINKTNKLLAGFQSRKIFPSVLLANKKRDVETGRIVETTLPPVDLNGMTCLIVDDIIDGGGTFIELAKKLKEHGAKEVILYATHGIFSKGLKPFSNYIDYIVTYHIVGSYINEMDLINFNSYGDYK